MALRRLSLAGLAAAAICCAPTLARAEERRPSFLHGVGQIVGGIVLEFPKTVVEATITGPPIVGTAVGMLAGLSKAGQLTIRGVREMILGFDPWGIKRGD